MLGRSIGKGKDQKTVRCIIMPNEIFVGSPAVSTSVPSVAEFSNRQQTRKQSQQSKPCWSSISQVEIWLIKFHSGVDGSPPWSPSLHTRRTSSHAAVRRRQRAPERADALSVDAMRVSHFIQCTVNILLIDGSAYFGAAGVIAVRSWIPSTGLQRTVTDPKRIVLRRSTATLYFSAIGLGSFSPPLPWEGLLGL